MPLRALLTRFVMPFATLLDPRRKDSGKEVVRCLSGAMTLQARCYPDPSLALQHTATSHDGSRLCLGVGPLQQQLPGYTVISNDSTTYSGVLYSNVL